MRACWLIGLVPVRLVAQLALPFHMAANDDVSMRIWVPVGTVRIQAWDRDSIQVTGTVAPNAHLFGGGGPRGAKFGVELNAPGNLGMARGDLVVSVPRRAHVWVKMTDGQVIATGTAGELDIITVTGTIDVHDARGVVSIETIDGVTSIARIQGEVGARGGGGRISLTDIGGSITAATIGGAIALGGPMLEDSRLETIGGTISVHGSAAKEALLDLETHSGSITLNFNCDLAPTLDLQSRGGKVGNPRATSAKSQGRVVARSFKGDINVGKCTGVEGRKATPP